MNKPLLTVFAATVACLAVLSTPAEAAARKKAAKPAAETVLPNASEEQLAAAERVGYGEYACEFNQVVKIDRHAGQPGYVKLSYKNKGWTMKPVVSSTGAVRMEDVRGEALMLQIANKSMLLNPKSGQRMVDDCHAGDQHVAAQSALQ